MWHVRLSESDTGETVTRNDYTAVRPGTAIRRLRKHCQGDARRYAYPEFRRAEAARCARDDERTPFACPEWAHHDDPSVRVRFGQGNR